MEVERPTRVCHASGKPIRPGDVYFTALIETPVGPQRRDFSAEQWVGPPAESVAHWKGRLPKESKPAPTRALTPELMHATLDQWIDAKDRPTRERVYVLALLLMRRKALKLHGVEQDGAEEYLLVKPSRSKTIYRIWDPRLTEDDAQRLEDTLLTELASSAE